jgi:4-amino-4-deoxy-L-arabinose transferase-like glycosyltransferase
MRASDDLDYAHLAQALLQPEQALMAARSHHVARLGMTVPLAMVYSVFGVSSWSLALPPLLFTALSAVLVTILARRLVGADAALLAGCLYALFPLTVDLATFYVPEPFVVCEVTLATIFLLSAIEKEGRGAHCLAIASGMLVGIAYLTTEAGSLMIVVFGICLGVKRHVRRHYLWLVAGFTAVLGAELAYHAAMHGNPLYRFTLTEEYMIRDAMVRSANVDLVDRLLKAYPRMFLYPNIDFGAFGPLLLLGGAYGLLRFRSCSFLVIWAAVMFCFYNFMSASFTHYVALPVAPRLMALGCIPLLILAGKIGADLWRGVRGSDSPMVRTVGHAALAVALGGLVGVSVLCSYLGANTGLRAVLARNAEAAAEYLRDVPSVLLVSDSRSAKAVQFLRAFNPTDAFVSFEGATHAVRRRPVSIPEAETFVLLNGPVLYEKEIAGFQYDRKSHLISDPSLSRFQPGPNTRVFSARFERGPVFHALLRYPWVQGLLGAYGYRIATNVFGADPRFGQVQVFRSELARD